MLILPGLSFGQDEAAQKPFVEQYLGEIALGLTVLVALVAIMAMYVMLMAMKAMLKLRRQEQGIEVEEDFIAVKEGEEGVGFWRRFWNRLNDSVPVSREAEVATGHEYDGIRELDNRLPPWWLYGFYFTIAFAVVYMFRFYFLDMPKQEEEYQAEMVKAKEEVQVYLASLDNLIDESSVTLTEETVDLDAGKAIFDANCALCHANDGGGGIGPNLTDQYWLHGGDLVSIFSTIKYGVPAKGMISWETQLSPKKMQQVASYIYMMEGSTPANPKEPQGDIFTRAHEADVSPDAEVELEEAEEIGEMSTSVE